MICRCVVGRHAVFVSYQAVFVVCLLGRPCTDRRWRGKKRCCGFYIVGESKKIGGWCDFFYLSGFSKAHRRVCHPTYIKRMALEYCSVIFDSCSANMSDMLEMYSDRLVYQSQVLTPIQAIQNSSPSWDYPF